MFSIAIDGYSEPSKYNITQQTKPTISAPTDVTIKVHAPSINPIDVKRAKGFMKTIVQDPFPYKIGYDCAGVIEEIGAEVRNLKVGDEVFACLPDFARGSITSAGAWSEYAKCPEKYIVLKPANLTFTQAASLPLVGLTALQALRKYNGSLEGKTVFIPAGLSGTGSVACQLAKTVFKAGKVITTVSTAKLPKVPEVFGEGIVDEIIDYTKQNLKDVIAPKSIDFYFDTTGQHLEYLTLMKPSTSMIVSISSTPSGSVIQATLAHQTPENTPTRKVPFLIKTFLDASDAVRRFQAKRGGVGDYQFLFVAENGEELEELKGYVEAGKLKPVVGSTVDVRDIEKLRQACNLTNQGKGPVGKTVLEIIKS